MQLILGKALLGQSGVEWSVSLLHIFTCMQSVARPDSKSEITLDTDTLLHAPLHGQLSVDTLHDKLKCPWGRVGT